MASQRRYPGIMALQLLAVLCLVSTAWARATINGTSITGEESELDVSRLPAIWTGNFADCMDDESLFNVTKFDAAYYSDNSTVLFHLDGSTNIQSADIMSMDPRSECAQSKADH
jgi:hypothetical protein